MSVPISNVPRRVVYTASGVGPYAFTFEILTQSDIAVYKDDTLLTLTTDYTVTINVNGTGSVTLTASPTGATQIAIVGDRTIARTTDFTTGGDLFANSLNDELDQQTIFAQQNAEAISRAIVAPQTDPTTVNMVLPRSTVRAGKYLGFDSSGNPIAQGDIPDTIYYGTSPTDPTTRSNGTALQAGDIYFNTTGNELRVYDGSSWLAVTKDASSVRTGVATAGQTTFTVTGGYVAGKIQVFVNGILLYPTTSAAAPTGLYVTYTATNGTSITFSEGLKLNDEITVIVNKSVGSITVSDITDLTVSTDPASGSALDGAIWFRV